MQTASVIFCIDAHTHIQPAQRKPPCYTSNMQLATIILCARCKHPTLRKTCTAAEVSFHPAGGIADCSEAPEYSSPQNPPSWMRLDSARVGRNVHVIHALSMCTMRAYALQGSLLASRPLALLLRWWMLHLWLLPCRSRCNL